MASGIYNKLKANLANKIVDIEVDTLKIALLDSNHSFDADNNTWADVSANEVVGTGYTAGGATLANASVTQDNTNDLAKIDADDVVWSGSTITASFAVIYDDTLANKDLICCIDFGGDVSSTNGDFTIEFNASGIITIT